MKCNFESYTIEEPKRVFTVYSMTNFDNMRVLLQVPSSQLLSFNEKEVKVRLWHDQLFAKPAGHGGCVAWHQDYSYWTRTYPMRHLTVSAVP